MVINMAQHLDFWSAVYVLFALFCLSLIHSDSQKRDLSPFEKFMFFFFKITLVLVPVIAMSNWFKR